MHTAFILAGGAATRWADYGGVAKHFVEIDGERLIDRTIRQARQLFDRVVVVSPHANYVVGVDGEIVVPHEHRKSERQKILSSKGEWSDSRTTLLYGDVYFTDTAIKNIAASVKPLTFLLRFDNPAFTGKTHREIFAIGFSREMYGFVEKAMVNTAYQHGIPQRGGWMLLDRLKTAAWVIETGDETEDFDSPEDYVGWMKATGRRG
jgi:hypothetical protein